MITWKDSYSIGVFELDEQHKNLFQYSNDLEEGLKQGGVSKQALDGALRFLEKYVKDHFSHEESCMNRYICPVAAINKLAHQRFIDAYKIFQKKISEGGDNEVILKELHHFIETWLTDHICAIDAQLKPCVH